MNEQIYPLTFVPEFRDYIWGGRRLETLLGRQIPPGVVAESWDISGYPSSPTRVAAGYWQGKTLPEVLSALGTDLVGTNSQEMLARGKFPLLIKLLDANRDLSVQVHPDDAYAQAHENGELGKTEMWYVLHTEPRTELIYGLARGVTKESFRRAILDNTLQTQLHRLPITPGDTIFLPSGSVHALLAGAVVAEIQQNSDTTYRVYDWGRLGDDGRPRPLHIDKALEVINWRQVTPGKARPLMLSQDAQVRVEQLVDSPQFTVERVLAAQRANVPGRCAGRAFEVWGCMRGESVIQTANGVAVPLKAVSWALLPAALGEYTIHAVRPSTLLRTYVRD